jgi:hypothetical protein
MAEFVLLRSLQHWHCTRHVFPYLPRRGARFLHFLHWDRSWNYIHELPATHTFPLYGSHALRFVFPSGSNERYSQASLTSLPRNFSPCRGISAPPAYDIVTSSFDAYPDRVCCRFHAPLSALPHHREPHVFPGNTLSTGLRSYAT